MDEQVRPLVEKAVTLLNAGNLAGAAVHFSEAVKLDPQDVALRQRLGDVFLRMGHRPHAIREFNHVAGRYAAEGQLLKAIAICKVILALDPEQQEALHTLAELYALQYETMPIVHKLPKSMSAALPDAQEHPTEPELNPVGGAPLDLDSLSVFQTALSQVAASAPTEQIRLSTFGDDDDEGEEAAVHGARPRNIDLTKLPPSPLFGALDKKAFEALVDKLDLRWMKQGETIIKEGDLGNSMYVVVQGTVEVSRPEAATGATAVLAIMREGAFFGEMALVADSRRIASVTATSDGLLLEIRRSRLDEIAAQHPRVREVLEAFYKDRLLSNALRASPVFRVLSEKKRAEVSGHFIRHSLPPQTVLLEQGKPGGGFLLLLRGKCEVFHTGGRGERALLPDLKEGDIFGEISLLLDGPCTATVKTTTFCEVLELPRDEFKRLVLPHPMVREMVHKLMNERIQRTADLLDRENIILPDYIV